MDASQNETAVTLSAALFPFFIGTPFELLGRRFGERGNTYGSKQMFRAVFPITFLSLLMCLCSRFIISSLPSVWSVTIAVILQSVLELILRGTLHLQIKFLRRVRRIPKPETDRYLKTSEARMYFASIVLARSLAEHVIYGFPLLLSFCLWAKK